MKAQAGDSITVTYTGTLPSGEVFDSTGDSAPLEFTIGDGSVMPAFEQRVIGMAEGEQKTFTLSPEEGYGASNPELVHTVRRDILPASDELRVGMVLALSVERDGRTHKVPATLTALSDTEATVDFNHPLAGQPLTFEVTVTAIRRPGTAATQ